MKRFVFLLINSVFTVFEPFLVMVKQMKQLLGSAKFLQSSKDLYEWMEDLLIKVQPKQNLDMQRIEKEGFGPEAHVEEPNDNTKMVT